MVAILRTVDVIIPVFRDFKRTRDCVESVLTSANETLLHLVVINDASPESKLTKWLQKRAPSAPFQLIEHAENGGFVASANEGMQLHPERDVVLLNSDTVVVGDWLDRLLACAEAESRVGTVTPFSNNATICSFPEPNVANDLPAGWTVTRMDALFARVNAGQSCEIPTGVGFCLFIRRGCLDDIGEFDEQRFGRGYGEENDFCLRASARDWLHRLCADVFVYHAGGTSFGAEARQLQLRAAAIMEGLHPGYEKLVSDFARLDPAAPLRERVSEELLLQSLADTAALAPSVLHVLGLGGGGSALHVRQLAATDLSGAAPMHLILFLGARNIFLQDLRTGLFYPLSGREDLTATLATILHALGVVTIHWHIVNDTVILLADALTRSGCRQVVTLHDIGFATLSAFSGQESLQPVDDEDWRRRVTAFLQRVDAVLAPSHFVADLCDAVTDGAVVATVVPHPAPPQPKVPSAIDEGEVARQCRGAGFVVGDPVVALVGALGEHKGAEHWRQMRKAGLEHGKGVNWVLIGYADPELRPSVEERCVVHGAYLPEDLAGLLDGYGADLVYFPPGMPESFSYALSDVWLAGWPVVVHDRGALGERLRAHARGGWILPSALDPQESLDALHALLEDSTGVARAKRAVCNAAHEWLAPPEPIGPIMMEIWMTNTKAGPVDAGNVMALQGLLRTHLDDSFFRPELIRLSGENQDLRRQATELQAAVKALGDLADEREKWAMRLERDVADLSELAAHRERWADKLQRDVEALRQASADLFTEKQALLRDKQAVLAQSTARSESGIDLRSGKPAPDALHPRERVVETTVGQGPEISGKLEGQELMIGALDVFVVTYEPDEALLGQVVDALAGQDLHGFDTVRLHVWDNSTDPSRLGALRDLLDARKTRLSSIQLHSEGRNLGFGQGHNRLLSLSSAPWVLLLNQDAVPEPDALAVLTEYIERDSARVGVWELRQIPYEHPKIYDPSSLDTPWVSGAACLLRREAFEAVSGFDPRIFMYAEDVDLSWRLRAEGWSLRYLPRAAVFHDTYSRPNEEKPLQAVEGTLTNLKMRARFGRWRDVLVGVLGVIREIARPASFPGRRRYFLGVLPRFLRHLPAFRRSGRRYRGQFNPVFIGWDFALRRDGAFFHFLCRAEWEVLPLVSVIVRTHRRPAMLREALQSLVHQTYPNLEIVVVEDGDDTARQMIQNEFSSHPRLQYVATGTPAGRSRAGNLGLERASGDWLGFLDDDDQLFADHVEVVLQTALAAGVKGAYGIAWEVATDIISREPLTYVETAHSARNRQPFSRPVLWHHNFIPIQSALFHRSLYERHGGFAEDMDQLEDWNLWTRYTLHDDFVLVEKTTSKYRVPSCPQHSAERQLKLDHAYAQALERQRELRIMISPREFMELAEEYVRGNSVVVVTQGDVRGWMNRLGAMHFARRVRAKFLMLKRALTA